MTNVIDARARFVKRELTDGAKVKMTERELADQKLDAMIQEVVAVSAALKKLRTKLCDKR